MRKLIFAATSVSALALAPAAMAATTNCDDGWTALDETYTAAAREGAVNTALQGDIMNLKRAAMTLNEAGYSDACESIVEALKDIAENEDARERYATASNQYYGTYGVDRYVADWKADLERSVSFEKAEMMDTEDLEDMDAHSSVTGEDIGAVDRVLMKGGKPAYVVLGHGGFLGIGDKEILIPIEKAKFSAESETMYLDMTDEQLDRAPDFDEERYEADREAYVDDVMANWKN